MKRTAALAAMLVLLVLPARAPGAGADNVEAIEKDLAAVLAEIEAVRSELDRIGEIAALPKATFLRIEVHGVRGVSAPAACRLVLQGKTEDEREWTRAEREAFAGGSPLVIQIPYFPGLHRGRIEVAHPSWKNPVASEFQANVAKGETSSLRFMLSAQPGKGDPALAPVPEK